MCLPPTASGKDIFPTLTASMSSKLWLGNQEAFSGDYYIMETRNKPDGFKKQYIVRRLTPTECERLMGFPDGYTDIPWPRGQCPDSHRYKALGNSMAVPVMRLIAESIDYALSHPITEDKSDKIAYQTSLFDF